MKLKLKFLRPFSEAVGKGDLEIDFKDKTINALIKELTEKYPKIKKEIYNENSELTEYICIFVNDKPITALKGVDTVLKNGDEVLFFMPISGG